MDKEYYVYATQTTTFRATITASSLEEAREKGIELNEGWKEVGELEWADLPGDTEET